MTRCYASETYRDSVCDDGVGLHDDGYRTVVKQVPEGLDGLRDEPHGQQGGEGA